MSTLPEMDWPNIWSPGFTLRPASFCKGCYQHSDDTRVGKVKEGKKKLLFDPSLHFSKD